MPSVNVHVDRETHARIRELARKEGVSMREMLDRVVSWYLARLREKQQAAPDRSDQEPVRP